MDFLNSTSTDILGLDFLNNLSISFVKIKPILMIFFLIFLIIYLIISSILFYHWEQYGMGNKKILIYGLVFFIVSLILFIIGFGILINL